MRIAAAGTETVWGGATGQRDPVDPGPPGRPELARNVYLRAATTASVPRTIPAADEEDSSSPSAARSRRSGAANRRSSGTYTPQPHKYTPPLAAQYYFSCTLNARNCVSNH